MKAVCGTRCAGCFMMHSQSSDASKQSEWTTMIYESREQAVSRPSAPSLVLLARPTKMVMHNIRAGRHRAIVAGGPHARRHSTS